MKTYTPENLKRWEAPEYWAGKPWPDYYVFLGQHRDSDCLSRSNFRSALKTLGGEDDNHVVIVRERHWACGWIEWIAIHESASDALETADEIAGALSSYPVVNEEDFSELEMEEADDVWRNCYDSRDRVAYIRENRYQFDFHNFSDLLSCVRGKYFIGDVSGLLS
jgi:hypothetical protein